MSEQKREMLAARAAKEDWGDSNIEAEGPREVHMRRAVLFELKAPDVVLRGLMNYFAAGRHCGPKHSEPEWSTWSPRSGDVTLGG